MIRQRLTDEQWGRIAHLIPGKRGDPGRTGTDNRLVVDAIVWMARTGTPWRDLSPFFGKWNSVWKRFRRWAKAAAVRNEARHLSLRRTMSFIICCSASRSLSSK